MSGCAWLHDGKHAVYLDVQVQPGAARSEIVGQHGDALKVRLAAPPVEGKANRELCRFLAGVLALPGAGIELCKGDKGRRKRVALHGLTLAEATLRLTAASPAEGAHA